MSKQVLQWIKKERKNSIYDYRIINHDTDIRLSEKSDGCSWTVQMGVCCFRCFKISRLIPIKGRLILRGQMQVQVNQVPKGGWMKFKGLLCYANTVSFQVLKKCKFQPDQIRNKNLVVITFICWLIQTDRPNWRWKKISRSKLTDNYCCCRCCFFVFWQKYCHLKILFSTCVFVEIQTQINIRFVI